MFFKTNFSLLGIFILTINTSCAITYKERIKRFLIVPPTAPTRHQLICGIGVPIQSEVNVISGWVLKGQYFIPTSANDLKGNVFPGIFDNFSTTTQFGQVGWRRKKRDILVDPLTGREYEKYFVDVEELEVTEPSVLKNSESFEDGDDDYWLNDLEFPEKEPSIPVETKIKDHTENSRWLAYKGLEALAETQGYTGRPCVLRGICETAKSQFTHENGLLSEILNVILTPSSTSEHISHPTDNEYLRAEKMGRKGEPCAEIFHECKHSMLDVFSQVRDPIEGLSQFMF